jgi:hypothetical protein
MPITTAMTNKFIFGFLLFFTANIGINAQGIIIGNGATLNINGAGNLVINNGGLSNAGTFTAGTGTVVLTGTAQPASTSLSGTSPINFYNLSINKTGGSARLLRNTSITNNLLLNNGNIDLNGFDIDLGLTGSLVGESVLSTFVGPTGGSINRTILLNAPINVNPGNLGIEITSAANLGLSVIKRGHTQQVNSSGFSINRYFDIIPTNNTALNASIKMYYQDTELAGVNENELKLWSKPVAANVLWTLLGANAQDASANWVSKSGLDSLNRYTLASSINNPLPFQLISFSGLLQNNGVQLNWSTLTEVNSKSFEIQKALDGRNFKNIATAVAAGNSNIIRSYSFFDATNLMPTAYYRLKLINSDGSFTYSNIVLITNGSFNSSFVNVYPNPAREKVQLRFISSSINTILLLISDSDGKLVASKSIDVIKGINSAEYNLNKLPQGIYYFRLVGIDNKIIKVLKY